MAYALFFFTDFVPSDSDVPCGVFISQQWHLSGIKPKHSIYLHHYYHLCSFWFVSGRGFLAEWSHVTASKAMLCVQLNKQQHIVLHQGLLQKPVSVSLDNIFLDMPTLPPQLSIRKIYECNILSFFSKYTAFPHFHFQNVRKSIPRLSSVFHCSHLSLCSLLIVSLHETSSLLQQKWIQNRSSLIETLRYCWMLCFLPDWRTLAVVSMLI